MLMRSPTQKMRSQTRAFMWQQWRCVSITDVGLWTKEWYWWLCSQGCET
jgi:hypothetical protein